ncbi:MAG: 2-oxoglutarate and iron-dependent oxygenase domain-containing protein [Planctomycetota bacterium]
MTVLRCFDAEGLDASAAVAALRDVGALRLRSRALTPAACRAALAAAGAFFALPAGAKDAIHIRRSPHHRGYSVMHGERDHREQVHFGREEPARQTGAPHDRLRGPNQWPDGPLRAALEPFLLAVERAGTGLSAAIAGGLGFARDPLTAAGAPYVLLKAICYHPQSGDAPPRPGVAAHVDFSWLTLTLADATGGLALRARDGAWWDVPPDDTALLVHTGELLQFATGGAVSATPHRVANRSCAARRLSLPTFLLPNFAAVLHAPAAGRVVDVPPGDHVHRGLVGAPTGELAVGPEEWRRKGENRWCTRCCDGP